MLARDRCHQLEDRICFHLLAYTGMRHTEAGKLTSLDVNLQRGDIKVIGKGDRPRLVPIHPVLSEVLNAAPKYRHGRPNVVAGPRGGAGRYLMDQIAQRILDGLDHTMHHFHRTVATNLRRNGVQREDIDNILGWAPVSIRQRYHDVPQPEDAHAAILKLYANDPT